MGKKEFLVSKIILVLHDDQSQKFQEEDFLKREKDQCHIMKLEILILQLFQNGVINDMRQEEELFLKSDIFYEAWLFGYISLSKDVDHARNLKIGIQGVRLYLSLQ